MEYKYPYTDFNEYNLDWLIVRIKELTEQWVAYKTQMDEDWGAVSAEWTDMKADLEELKAYITNYFDNLDVQQEINNKIDEMAADGSLLSIIRSTVVAQTTTATEAWLTAHVSPETGYVIDNTLSVSGAAADAKVTGDGIRGLDLRLTVVEDDLEEFKDGFASENIFKTAELLYEDGYAVIVNGEVSSKVSNPDYNCYMLPVDGASVYSFTMTRFAFLVESDRTTAIGDLLERMTQIDSTGASYICFTVDKDLYPLTDYIVTKGPYLSDDFILPEWFNEKIEPVNEELFAIKYDYGMNLFSYAELLAEDKYATIVDGHVGFMPLSDYRAYLMPTNGKTSFNLTECRFAFLVDSDKYTVLSDLFQYVTVINAEDAPYICFSVNTENHPINTFEIIGNSGAKDKPKSKIVTGELSFGHPVQLPAVRNSLRKGERIVFNADITTFNDITIGGAFNADVETLSSQVNAFVIDQTKISYYLNRTTSDPVEVNHGLTIQNNIQILLEIGDDGECTITLISNGNSYSHKFEDYYKRVASNPFAATTGSVLTDAELSWSCTDFDCNIWIFGDSYIAYSESRWTYYLTDHGYAKNALINGCPGEGSTNAKNSLINLLNYGSPKIALWTLGMNDGSDSESEPNSNWSEKRDIFLEYCSLNNIVPVFGTIPTIPSVNNENKNDWIRNSGYRYIDFAKAVGATSDGSWYQGMLSPDNIHPTAAGAKALFMKAIADLPELMVSNLYY